MKTYISKGTGIGLENKKRFKIHPETREFIRGQLRENKILLIEGRKYWQKDTATVSEFYADVFFIFNFPQRKISKALKEKKQC